MIHDGIPREDSAGTGILRAYNGTAVPERCNPGGPSQLTRRTGLARESGAEVFDLVMVITSVSSERSI